MQLYEFGPFTLNSSEHLLLRDGHPIPIKPKIFHLLLLLVQNSGHLLSKDFLVKQLWPESFVEENNLAVNISALRRVLNEDSKNRYIETVPRRGYRFIANVREASDQIINPMENQPTIFGNILDSEYQTRAGLQTLAVLPFKAIGDIKDNYLGLGIADALITKLTNLSQFIVRSTSAVRNYADERSLAKVSQELRVDLVLDGNIQRIGDRIRVTVQLVRVSDGASLWAGRFDEQLTDILAIEDVISEGVARILMPRFPREVKRRLAERYTKNIKAYQAYMKGRYFCDKRSVEGLKKAMEQFETAIALDSNYALAYVGLADACTLLYAYEFHSRNEFISKAKEAVIKALALNKSLAEAHTSLAFLLMNSDWDWSAVEPVFRQVLELNPHYEQAHLFYSVYLADVGRFNEAMAEAQTVLEFNPASLPANSRVGVILYLSRQYDQAIKQFQNVIELNASYISSYLFLALTYEQKRMYEEAIAEVQKAIDIAGRDPEILAGLAHIYATSGKQAEARKILIELKELSKQSYVAPSYIGLIHAGLDEKDEAFACLEEGYIKRDSDLALLRVDPRWDGLRADSRFTDLLRRIECLA